MDQTHTDSAPVLPDATDYDPMNTEDTLKSTDTLINRQSHLIPIRRQSLPPMPDQEVLQNIPVEVQSRIIPQRRQSLPPIPDPYVLQNGPVQVPQEKSQSVLVFPPITIKEKTDESQRKRRCRCCPQSRRGRIICISTIVGLLLILIILLSLYVPRLPEFKVLYVQVRPVNGEIPLNVTQRSINPTNISLQLPIFMGVSVVNPNRYDLTVDTFDLTAYIRPNVTALKGSGLPGSLMSKTSDTKVGYGAYGSKNFPSYENTTFEIQVSLEYTPDPKLGLLNDPAFGDLLQVCGVNTTSENRTMTVKYDVGITIGFLARLGIYPLLPNEVSIKCPLPSKKVDDLLNRFDIGV